MTLKRSVKSTSDLYFLKSFIQSRKNKSDSKGFIFLTSSPQRNFGSFFFKFSFLSFFFEFYKVFITYRYTLFCLGLLCFAQMILSPFFTLRVTLSPSSLGEGNITSLVMEPLFHLLGDRVKKVKGSEGKGREQLSKEERQG